VPTATDYGWGFGGALPKTPLVARAVLCDPPWPTSLPNNAAALSNNIALLHRDPSGGVAAHSIWAQAAGARAVIVVDQDDQGGTGRLPGPWGGNGPVTIPVAMIDYNLGTNIYAQASTSASSPVVMRLGDDSSLELGEFNGGRGADTPTVFRVNVAQAGVYPLRMLYQNGGGDANVEWWTLANGVTNLINEAASNVKAYRARVVTTGAAQVAKPIVSGTNVIISWTGEGELEQAEKITGPWYKSPFQNNPSTVPMNPLIGTATYFRVRQF
jgi:hypothetical protein